MHLYQASTYIVILGNRTYTLHCNTSFPYNSDVAIRVEGPPEFAANLDLDLHLRIPSWISRPTTSIIATGTTPISVAHRGTYTHAHVSGPTATLVFALPMRFEVSRYPGLDQIGNTSRYAIEYGPTLLAAMGPWTNFSTNISCIVIPDMEPGRPANWLVPIQNKPLHFFVKGHPEYQYKPYFEIQNERFTVYPIMGKVRWADPQTQPQIVSV